MHTEDSAHHTGFGPRTLLLIVDLQKAFITHETRGIIHKIERIIPAYQHIAMTRFHNPVGSNYRKLLDWDACAMGNEDFDLAMDLPENAVVFDKSGYNGLTPLFRQMLFNLGIDVIHLCGMDTEACVLATAMGVFDVGLRPVVLASACASTNGEVMHRAGLEILRCNIGAAQVIS